MKVIGIQRNMQFKAPDGNLISGMNIYVTYEKSNVQGSVCEKFFVSCNKSCYQELAKELKLGDEVEVYFNRYGKVETVAIC